MSEDEVDYPERFHIRARPSWAIDDWRSKQDDLPSRSEAIRRLVTLAIRAKLK